VAKAAKLGGRGNWYLVAIADGNSVLVADRCEKYAQYRQKKGCPR